MKVPYYGVNYNNLDRSLIYSAPPHQTRQGIPPADHLDDLVVPGLYFPVETVRHEDEILQAYTSNGQPRPPVYLEPFALSNPMEDIAIDNPIASFGEIQLHQVETHTKPNLLTTTFLWSTNVPNRHNYHIALRVYDDQGFEWAGLDTQAGGVGLYPTGLWIPGEIVADRYQIQLPDGFPPGTYDLEIKLYDVRTLEPIGQYLLEGFTYTHLTPAECAPATLNIAEYIVIRTIDYPTIVAEGDNLHLEILWELTEIPEESLYVELQVGQRHVQFPFLAVTPDGPLESCATILQGQYVINTRDIPRGEHNIQLSLVDSDYELISEVITIGDVALEGRDRVFELPEFDQQLEIIFGEQLVLRGYSLQQSSSSLMLDVAWGALVKPDDGLHYLRPPI